MRDAGGRLAEVLRELKRAAVLGARTIDLDKLALKMIRERGAEPAFLNYRAPGGIEPYPFSLCVSINEEVVHGRPSDYALGDGDIVKLDLGLKYKGFYVDSAVTVGIGKINKEASKLISVTEKALYKGIGEAKPGKTTGDIGAAVEKYVISHKLSVIKSLTGHGIGTELHEEPSVYNYGKPGTGLALVPGMALAIEVMTGMGSGDIIQRPDESYAIRDGSLSAHFEHTIVVTDTAPRILTVV